MKKIDSYTQAAPKDTPFQVASDGAFKRSVESPAMDYMGSTATPLSMDSEDIADLVDTRHDKVKQFIDRLADRGVIQLPPALEIKNSGGQTVRRYIFQGDQGKRDSIIVVAQLSPELTARIVDRWQELEAQLSKEVAPALPNFSNPAEAARAWATEFEGRTLALEDLKVRDAKIAEDAPKVEVYHQIADSSGLIGFQKFCTQLNLKQKEVKHWMKEIGWLRAHQYLINPLPTAIAVDKGYCKITNFTTPSGHIKQTIRFTGKAITYAAEKAPEHIRKNTK